MKFGIFHIRRSMESQARSLFMAGTGVVEAEPDADDRAFRPRQESHVLSKMTMQVRLWMEKVRISWEPSSQI